MTNQEEMQSIINMRQRTTRLEREGDYWTEEEKFQLETLFEQGVGITQIALCLQRTEPAVFQQIEKMDLYERRRRPSRRRSVKQMICLCNRCECAGEQCEKGKREKR